MKQCIIYQIWTCLFTQCRKTKIIVSPKFTVSSVYSDFSYSVLFDLSNLYFRLRAQLEQTLALTAGTKERDWEVWHLTGIRLRLYLSSVLLNDMGGDQLWSDFVFVFLPDSSPESALGKDTGSVLWGFTAKCQPDWEKSSWFPGKAEAAALWCMWKFTLLVKPLTLSMLQEWI